MGQLKVVSHIIPDILHGGYDDAASLSLWIDEAKGIAHLCGHSGSMAPLDGPEAPSDAPYYEAIGRSGYAAIFSADEIEDLRSQLETALVGWTPAQDEALRPRIEEILEDVDLEQESYEDWTASEDPEVHADLYG